LWLEVEAMDWATTLNNWRNIQDRKILMLH
jgi:hypothetical protein